MATDRYHSRRRDTRDKCTVPITEERMQEYIEAIKYLEQDDIHFEIDLRGIYIRKRDNAGAYYKNTTVTDAVQSYKEFIDGHRDKH